MDIEAQDTGKSCRRYARQIWREQPDLPVEDMLKRNEIVWIALKGKHYDRKQILDWILPDATPHEELVFFRELSLWTIEEAVALLQDVNPFILLQSFHKHNPSFWNQAFHPNLRENYHVLLHKAKCCAITGELKAIRDESRYLVTPHDFYEWAVKNNVYPNGSRPEEFFAELNTEWVSAQANTEKPSKVDKKRNEIRRILALIKKIDLDFNLTSMPGRKADFHDLCIQQNNILFSISLSTFNDYLTGLCTFNSGARKTDYYKKIAEKLG